ncbi:uncharacterized protein LOC106062213 [Biomphalaria glabrata]|uniref:Uncharacterized protein LOC106062213 n=1 Tax=Biomphalaria glabrata TaxID=6526 RepID=A0A9W3BHG8_BIOGL|nr:uncharacterized protein LOC106062213 [Biomphalaria glabrata]XP_055899023.1 uncharacterized protein LOC106062213 [Biomphalaria glabrata]KAI8761055.1 hypothetical protein BgiMline_008208 [Biomphalaria glabrata]KAI8781198.1 hypothetical protein BgiBS90_018549 [Biomphalaria glabrata]
MKEEECSVLKSTCENPQFPNWMWRYNRNKRLSRFEPWFTRVERWPPQYRNMGLHDDFRFHPVGPDEELRPFLHLGVNYAHNLVLNRCAGSGNESLGFTPGPAPPRLVVYDVQNPYPRDDLYKVNEINNISPGMSLLDYSYLPTPENDNSREPIDPRRYLELTLGQKRDLPGTFPHFNAAGHQRLTQECKTNQSSGHLDPLEIWTQKYVRREQEHAAARALGKRKLLPPLLLQDCNFENKPAANYENMRPPVHKAGINNCVESVRKIY